jgi:hypothetical protein
VYDPAGTAISAITAHESAIDPHPQYNYTYTLPVASDTVLGGIKIGAGLVIDVDGTVTASGGSGSGNVTNGDAHDHLGGDGGTIAYTSLSGLPTLGTAAAANISDFAPAAKGVTNGDIHDHSGGDGAPIDHANLTSKGTNTHAQIDTHLASTSNPHATTAVQVGAYTTGQVDTLFTNHTGAVDPHPQYLTPAEGNAAYDGLGTAAGLVSAHEGAVDPHPQYLTPAEGNAAYEAAGTLTAHLAAGNPHSQYQLLSEKGQPSGYAPLDGSGLLPTSVLPTVTNYTHSNQAGGTLHAEVTTSVAGFMSASDKTKLDGIAVGATNYTNENAQDAIGILISAGTQLGVSVTYNDALNKIDFDAQTAGDSRYALAASGVTNGDSHDHSGGDGAQISHTSLSNIGTNTHAQIDTHISSISNPHSTTAAQVGAYTIGQVDTLFTNHTAAVDPHPGYLTPAEANLAYAALVNGVTGGDSHNHAGGDGAQIAHTDLSAIGTNTHAQIDTFIASKGAPNGLASLDANVRLVQSANTLFDGTAGRTASPASSANTIPVAGAGGTISSTFIPDLSATYAITANGVTNGDSHDHSGGDGAQINHTLLSNIGTNTHAQIDTFVGSKAAASGLASLNASSLVVQNPASATPTPTPSSIVISESGGTIAVGWIPDLSATYTINSHDHSGGDGATIDHVNLSNKGTNTHTQIDSHITTATAHLASTSNPHATTAAQVGAYTIAETDQAFADHLAELDPHSQYLKESDAAITYATINHIHDSGRRLVVKSSPAANEYSTLAAALAAIGTSLPVASSSVRYVIQLYPGVYTEDNSAGPITIPGYVYVSGFDPWNSAVLKASTNSNDFISVAANGGLFNVAVEGPTSTGKSAIICTGNGVTKLYWVNLKNGYYGVTLAPASAGTVTRCHAIGVVTDMFGVTMNRMFNCEYNATTSPGAGVFILMQSGPMSNNWSGSNPAAVYLVSDGLSPPKASATLDLCQFRGTANSAETGQVLSDVFADNGALVRGICCSFAGATSFPATTFRYAINSGPTPGTTYKTKIDIHGSQIKPGGYTKDIKIQNTETSTTYSGVATEANLEFVAGAKFVGSFADPNIGQVIYGELYIGNKDVKTPLASYVQADKNTGKVSGGGLSRGAGARQVDVAAGTAFIDSASGLVNVSWGATTVTVPANTAKARIYVTSGGVVTYSATAIDKTLNLQLGECGTNNTEVTFLFDQSITLPHFRAKLYEYLENVIGPINIDGGIVSINGTNALSLDVTDSTFFVTEDELVSTGGAAITFTYWYRNGVGEWVSVPSNTTVNVTNYDDGTGTLATLPAGKYKRDLSFVSTNSGGTEYHIVYGQEFFDAAVDATSNPIIPDVFKEHACRLYAIIVQKDATAIHSVVDQRPRLGQAAAAQTGVTNHNDLSGRDSVTAHTQYQLISEKNNANGYVGLNSSTKIDSTYLTLTSNAPTNVSTAVGSAGVSTELARADHLHSVSVGSPVAISTSNADGASTSLARADHVHAHGNLTGGSLHANATTGTAGFMSSTDKTKLDAVSYAIFEWGVSGVQTSTTDRFMSPGWINAVAGTTDSFQIRCTRAGTLRNLYVYANTAGASSNNIIYTVRVNGVDTALAATMAASAQNGQNTSDTVAVSAGDRISIKVSKPLTITTSPTNIFVTLELGA